MVMQFDIHKSFPEGMKSFPQLFHEPSPVTCSGKETAQLCLGKSGLHEGRLQTGSRSVPLHASGSELFKTTYLVDLVVLATPRVMRTSGRSSAMACSLFII